MKPKKYTRDKTIQVRLNKKEYEVLLNLCDNYQMTISELFRMLIWRMYDM